MTVVTGDGLPRLLQSIQATLRREYTERHSDPWLVAYSGGKDSTLLLQLVWEILLQLPSNQRKRPIYVVANDTLVESPVVISHLRQSLEKIKARAQEAALPITVRVTRPAADQTFWVSVIGRGYIPPTRNFRWCTDRMKIKPTNKLIERLVALHGGAVLLVGTRRSESQNRRRNMDKHSVTSDSMNPHSSIPGCRMFAPLADLNDDDVWMLLMQRRPPWGGTHRDLITIYRNAGGGECPLVLTEDDAPSCGTSSPRFGCWTCTVVEKDRSMRGTIDAGHNDQRKLELLFDFRQELINLREDNSNRMSIRRNGQTKIRSDGSLVYGPFTLEVREKLLRHLEHLEDEIGETLLSLSEREAIEDVWREDRVHETGRQALTDNLSRRHAWRLDIKRRPRSEQRLSV